MRRHAHNKHGIKGSILLAGILSLFFFSACSSSSMEEVDRLNDAAYSSHYRNLSSVVTYSEKALLASDGYPAGKAEAYNNLAFAAIAAMDYDKASRYLDSVDISTDNQVELLIADIQYMRLCQREARNKEFYDYRERASRRIKRVAEEKDVLSDHMNRRFLYAKTEFQIVCSTYYYYVGLTQQAVDAVMKIDPSGEIQKDTAQYLNYLYQLGSGGIISKKSRAETRQQEFDCLVKCYVLARGSGMIYWQANSLQALSEHLLDLDSRAALLADNQAAMKYINEDNMPDSLVAGYLAQRSFDMFFSYGDVYQTACAYRTLAFCYWALDDYVSSLICLENALKLNPVVNRAPSLVASIRESMSLVYSATGDKKNSDINRNAYLDIQDETRQDRQLEARAGQLERISKQLNILIMVVGLLIVAVVVSIFLFRKLGTRRTDKEYLDRLFEPLRRWESANALKTAEMDECHEAVKEQLQLGLYDLDKGKRRSLDNKAKVFLVNNVVPYIDRIINELGKVSNAGEADKSRNARLAYVVELTDRINEYNDVLTHWIQLQQGNLSLHIESFSLNDLFDMLSKSEMSFRLKGVTLEVCPTSATVKADKVLTLFMLNTLADNARKFTPSGGRVRVCAEAKDDYVEVSVADTGAGLDEEELAGIFDHKVKNGHGFGLMNCKGIIDKYKKVSRIFSVCGIFAESQKGGGSRFYFRLPVGVTRAATLFVAVCCLCAGLRAVGNGAQGKPSSSETASACLVKADSYADSAYFSNIAGTYSKTLEYADSSRYYLNLHYKKMYPEGKALMTATSVDNDVPAEIQWFRAGVNTDYDIILDIRNESAVASLALHEWSLYMYNNKIYTQLFKERSADNGLDDYCAMMQESGTNKTVALILLIFLLAVIIFSYYFLYYRHVLYFRFCVENVEKINSVLLSDTADEYKLAFIKTVGISKYPDVLKSLITRIREALERSAEVDREKMTDIECSEDELRRVKYETDKLYVSNSVIDNCLSTLKHETMYYPSRIRGLADNAGENIAAMSELAGYYKELYSVLCEQVGRQAGGITFECRPLPLAGLTGTDEYVLGDKALLEYLFDILRRQLGCGRGDAYLAKTTDRYVVVDMACRNADLTERQCKDLFTPSAANIPFLICRQIIREMAEQSNLHGCGIAVTPLAGGGVNVRLTLARARARRLKDDWKTENIFCYE